MLDVRCSPPGVGRARAAFTLVELLVVIAIITIFAGVIGFALRGGGGPTVGLQASQSILVGLLTQARSQAILTGRDAALLVHNDPVNHPERYLRYLVPVVRDAGDTTWVPLDVGTMLPKDCAVVPGSVPSGAWIESGAIWTELDSTALAHPGATASVAVEGTALQSWLVVRYSSRGTTANSGDIIVAGTRSLPEGSSTLFQFINPDNVRGVSVTGYGQSFLINDRASF